MEELYSKGSLSQKEKFFFKQNEEKKQKLSPCKACRIFLTLTRKTLLQARVRTKRDEQLLYVLQTRAWVCHMVITAVRLSQVIFSFGSWFEEK